MDNSNGENPLEEEVTQDMKVEKHGASGGFYAIVIILVIIILGALVFRFYPTFFGFISTDKEVVRETLDTVRVDFFEGDYDAAIAQGEQLLEQGHVNDNAVLATVALNYLQKGSVTYNEEENALRARALADQMIANNPNDYEAYRIRAYSYEIVEDYDRAIAEYKRMISFGKDLDIGYSQLGHVYDLIGDKETALEYYQKALEINPDRDNALLNIGRYYHAQGDLEQARSFYNQAIAVSALPILKVYALSALGDIELHNGNFEAAETHLRQSLEIESGLAYTWVALAEVQLAYAQDEDTSDDIVQIQAAKDSVDQALALHSDDTYAYILRGDIAKHEGEREVAEKAYQQALEKVAADITLGLNEKMDARRIIEEALGQLVNEK